MDSSAPFVSIQTGIDVVGGGDIGARIAAVALWRMAVVGVTVIDNVIGIVAAAGRISLAVVNIAVCIVVYRVLT